MTSPVTMATWSHFILSHICPTFSPYIVSLAVHIHTNLKAHITQTWYSTQGVPISGCHHMSQFEYKCCIYMCQIIKHHYARVDALQECSDDWMLYHTLHSCKGDHHYVLVEVLSDCSCDWMPYYTHHCYKDDHHYVCVDALSECSFD